MADPVRPVKLEVPLQGQKWTNPDGSATTYAHRYHHAVFMRLGAYNDDVWRALGVGFTGLTQINQVNQRVSDVEAATAAVQGAIAGIRGDPRLEDAVEALSVAITALVQVQARASGESDKRISDLDRLVSSLGARLTKSSQAVQMQVEAASSETTATQQLQASFVQRTALERVSIGTEIQAVEDGIPAAARSSLSGSAPVVYDDFTGEISLNASMTSLGGVTTAADKGYYTTALNSWASHDLTAFGRSVSALADAAAGRTLFALGNVDNTSDANKPVSTATQTALDLKADLAFPEFTGNVGIGTTPSALLHLYVNSTTNKPRLRLDRGTGAFTGNYGVEYYSGATFKGGFFVDASDNFNFFTASGASKLTIASGGAVTPGSDNTQTLGSAALRWSAVYGGSLIGDSLRINAAPTAAVVAQSHHVPVNINGTTYKLLLAS